MGLRFVALAAVAAVAAAALMGLGDTASRVRAQGPDVEYTGDVIVKFHEGASLADVGVALAASDTTAIDATEESGLVLLEPEAGQSVDDAVEALEADPDVAFAEADVVMRLSLTPNDPLYATYQWSLGMVGAPAAWDTTTGDASVIIAVLDTGVDGTHPDLSGKITTGGNAGYNFVANNTNTADDHSHGTFVAGIAAANSNNGQGMAGACWTCKIMPVKVLDSAGSGSSFNVSQGIDWAVSHGADVVNLSLGGGGTASLQTSVNNAWNAGVIVVAATGNDNGPVLYPAAYANAIAVGSVDSAGVRSSFSNYGPEIDVVAPGSGVLGTLCNCAGNPGGYGTGSGTSFSTPYVAGVAGLVIASGVTDKDEIRSRLLSTATDGGAAGFDNLYGWGRVNAGAAVAGGDNTPPSVSITSPANGATVSGVVNIAVNATDNVGVTKVRFSVGSTYLGYDSSAPYGMNLNTTSLPNGSHQITARGLDAANNSTTALITVNVNNSDSTPPLVGITSPADGAAVAGIITINATASDNNGVSKVRFSADSTYLGYDSSSPYSITLDTRTLTNGPHQITARAIDNANNSATAVITINVQNIDETPPTVAIVSPADGAVVSGVITISASAADGGGISKVRFSADSTYLGYDSSWPYTKMLDTTTLSNGTHQISARAFDNAGNSTTVFITVTVNN